MTVVTRFAPSPTGFLHIGGARTALYNWLYARRHGGKFLVRIEDTDRQRSTQQAVDAIIDGLNWLGLNGDGDIVYQFQRQNRHVEVAQQLIDQDQAYYCYCSKEELEKIKQESQSKGLTRLYDQRCRFRELKDIPPNVKPVVRLKAPQSGTSVIKDQVQGQVSISNEQLDDYILLRSDGTPTYMLSVVVDDHDMNVSHIIRGHDHLTNAFRQKALYEALGWSIPEFSHIPLIHGADGAKLSKRHGALGIDFYRDEMGMLPEALKNYLLRLGWGHGDEEVICEKRAQEIFDLKDVVKSPSRLDPKKMMHLNGLYLRNMEDKELFNKMKPLILKEKNQSFLSSKDEEKLILGMKSLKNRTKNIINLSKDCLFYVQFPCLSPDEINGESIVLLKNMVEDLQQLKPWTEENIDIYLNSKVKEMELRFIQIAQPLRLCLTGSKNSPSISEVMSILGQKETMKRILYYIKS